MDSLGQVLAAAIVLAGGVFACVCLLAAINLLLPGLVEPIRRRIDQGLLRPFLVGLGALIVFGGAWVALLAALIPGGKPAAVAVSIGIVFGFVCLVLAGLAVVTIYGLTALAAVMGQRQSTRCVSRHPLRRATHVSCLPRARRRLGPVHAFRDLHLARGRADGTVQPGAGPAGGLHDDARPLNQRRPSANSRCRATETGISSENSPDGGGTLAC